jgi:hypothetical protein
MTSNSNGRKKMTDPIPLPTPSEFKVIALSADIERPAEAAWSVIGAFGDAGRFFNVNCNLISGSGGLGSVRLIGSTIQEVMVGSSRHSYAYAQTRGPMAPFAYHGCIALEPSGPASCKLVYTLLYDQATMDAEKRASEATRIGAMFDRAIAAMKRETEANA